MPSSSAQTIGHRGHSEFVGLRSNHEATVAEHDVHSFDLDESLQRLRRPDRPVSAPPVTGLDQWEQGHAETPPPVQTVVPGMTPVLPRPAPNA